MATNFQLPVSNKAGNNQTSPGIGGATGKAPTLPFSSGSTTGQNPFFHSGPTPVAPGVSAFPQSGASSPVAPGLPATPQASGSDPWSSPSPYSQGSLYDPTSSYSNGMSNIDKQLIDMYGKGVGGMLNSILAGMSGTDSQIFKQWLAGQQPVQASERAQLQGTLGQEGISGNSSVSAIANSNLTAQFNAQAAQENSNLMTQQLQDTIGILTGMQGAASKEVASSGWTTFADVMNNITGDIGNLMGGSYQTNAGQGLPSAPTGMSNTAPYAAVQSQALPNAAPGSLMSYSDAQGLNSADAFNASLFDSSAPTVTPGF